MLDAGGLGMELAPPAERGPFEGSSSYFQLCSWSLIYPVCHYQLQQKTHGKEVGRFNEDVL
jgi:hypothetical protein